MTASEIDTVARIAALARLDISGPEAAALGGQFARILEQFQVLAATDVEGVEPMVGGLGPGAAQVAREDLPRPSSPPESLLGNAPARVGEFYSVPKTVGGDE
jgi:aspartyl-tRNA(Asn)/glutamyl-tRNA(Gln) amidotransferase subunit C